MLCPLRLKRSDWDFPNIVSSSSAGDRPGLLLRDALFVLEGRQTGVNRGVRNASKTELTEDGEQPSRGLPTVDRLRSQSIPREQRWAKVGGVDGTRTRGLRRDRGAF